MNEAPSRFKSIAMAVLAVLVALALVALTSNLLGQGAGGNGGSGGVVLPLPKSAAARIRMIERQEVAIRGLRSLHPVTVRLLTSAAFTRRVLKILGGQNSAASNKINRAEMVLPGLVPPSTNLGGALTKAYAQQIIGLYDHQSKRLYIRNSGQALGIDRWTIAHEYTHAMQDQHFDLARVEPYSTHWTYHNSDAYLAEKSLIEGDAVDVQYAYLDDYYSTSERAALIRQQQSLPSTTGVPRALEEQFNFPYTAGPSYVTYLLHLGGYAAVNQAFRHPPHTTYQLMFPGRAVHPRAVHLHHVLGRFRDWTVLDDDVDGAFGYRQLVEQYAGNNAAGNLASLWRGDRYVLLRHGSRYAMYMKSAYAGPAATAQAAAIIQDSLAVRFRGLRAFHGAQWGERGHIFGAMWVHSHFISLAYGYSPSIVRALVKSTTR